MDHRTQMCVKPKMTTGPCNLLQKSILTINKATGKGDSVRNQKGGEMTTLLHNPKRFAYKEGSPSTALSKARIWRRGELKMRWEGFQQNHC